MTLVLTLLGIAFHKKRCVNLRCQYEFNFPSQDEKPIAQKSKSNTGQYSEKPEKPRENDKRLENQAEEQKKEERPPLNVEAVSESVLDV